MVGEDTIPGYVVRASGSGPDYLNNYQSVVYVDDEGRPPVAGKLNQALAGKARVILVPDGCRVENFNYIPKKAFKILFHSNKSSEDKIRTLKENPFFQGELFSVEAAPTPYGLLANAIRLNSLAADLRRVLDQIPTFDAALEARLELLQDLLSRREPRREVLDFLKDSQPKLETDLKKFKGIKTDVFSAEYQVAYNKLLESLKIQ
jgi:hypothetical protein